MPSNEYKIMKTNLHKEKYRDLIEYIDGLLPSFKQKFLRDALVYFRRCMEEPGFPGVPIPAPEQPPAPGTGGGVKVLKKISLGRLEDQ